MQKMLVLRRIVHVESLRKILVYLFCSIFFTKKKKQKFWNRKWKTQICFC